MSETNETGAVAAEKPASNDDLESIVIEEVKKGEKKPRARRVMTLSIPALKMILGNAIDLQGNSLDGDTQTSILYESCIAGHLEPPRDLKREMKDVRARQAELKTFLAQKEVPAPAAAPAPPPVNTSGPIQVGERVVVNDLSNPQWAGVAEVVDTSDSFHLRVAMLTGQRGGQQGTFRRSTITREAPGATLPSPRVYQVGDRVNVRVQGSRHWNGSAEVIRAATSPTDDILVRMLDGSRANREGTFLASQLTFVSAAPSGRFRIGNRVVINEPSRANWHNGTAEVTSVNNGRGSISVRMLSQGQSTGQQADFPEDRLTLAVGNTLTITTAESTNGGSQWQIGDQVTTNVPGNPDWCASGVIEDFQNEFLRVRITSGRNTGQVGSLYRNQVTLVTPVAVPGTTGGVETFTTGAAVTVNLGPFSQWNGNGTVQSATPGGIVRVMMISGGRNGNLGSFQRNQLTLGHAPAPREFQPGDIVTTNVGHASNWNGNGTVVSSNGSYVNIRMTSGANSGRATDFDRTSVTLVTAVRPYQAGDVVTTNLGYASAWNGNGTVLSQHRNGNVQVRMTSGGNSGQTTEFLREHVTLVTPATPTPAAAAPTTTTAAAAPEAAPAAPAAAPAVPAPIVVGTRVRVNNPTSSAWNGDGEVVEVSGPDARVQMASGGMAGQRGWFNMAINLTRI